MRTNEKTFILGTNDEYMSCGHNDFLSWVIKMLKRERCFKIHQHLQYYFWIYSWKLSLIAN